jgi:hypothetical protein
MSQTSFQNGLILDMQYVIISHSFNQIMPGALGYYSPEARFYGQTLFLSMSSSYTLYTPAILEDDNIREIEEHDYLVLAFMHNNLNANRFPIIIQLISDKYDLIYSNLDARGRGYMIFSTH